MKSKATVLILMLIGLPLWGMAQVDSTAADTLPVNPVPDSLAISQPDTLKPDSVKPLFNVRPWAYHAPLHADVAATDSTMRWQLWPSWVYKKNREPGVITYRLGTIGRTNAQQIDAHEPKYQQLYWEDINLSDPVSGIVNWNYIPHHKIKNLYEDDLGTIHRTKFYLNEYYLNKPLTRLNYTESSFDTRNLEFVVSQNFSQKTNAEISYWDRRDGGEYDNSGITGRQIYARVSHQLDHRQKIKFRFLNNSYDNGLPFGYNVPDPNLFPFDRFLASANEPSGDESRTSSIIGLNYYRRPADTTKTTSNFESGIFMNTTNREVSYLADTTAYNVRALGATVRKWQQLGPVDMEGAASYEYFLNRDESTLATGNWGLLTAETKADFQPLPLVSLHAQGNYRTRSDAFSDYRLGIDAMVSIGSSINFKTGITMGSLMPTPQQLYWQATEFEGDTGLKKEQIQQLHASLEVAPFLGSTVGIQVQLKQIDDGIMIGTDNIFSNSNAYSSLSTAAFLEYNSTHFEFSGSATLQQFGNFIKSRSNAIPFDETERIWFKGGAYIKGYLFNQATYVKGGVSGMITPQVYNPAQYYPSLDFWQSGKNNDPFIPTFSNLDVDLSARLRSIIILLRYENVLDDVVQRGYFETAGYPMPNRRFLFGVRVLLRN